MAQSSDLVRNVQEDHDELSGLIAQFRNALSSKRKKEAGKIFAKLDKTLARHFNFEVNYLYPRMKRLILEIAQKLCTRQEQIKASIEKSKEMLNKRKTNKNKISMITNTLDMISNHLGDCAGIVSLANCFSEEEKDELGQRFKEYCVIDDQMKGG